MSFNIPIIFDDSPFSEWGDARRPQHGRNYQSSGRRQPSVFGQWEDPEFFYDYSARKQHYRPNYGEKQREYYRQFPEKHRFHDEGGQEDIYDTEEQRRAPRSNFGYDGWDIPVQHMDRASHKHHKHKHMPKQKSKAQHDINYDNELKQPQTKVNEASNANEVASDTEPEHCNVAMKVKTGKQSETIPEKQNMKQQSSDDSNTKSFSQTTKGSSQTTEGSSQTTKGSSQTTKGSSQTTKGSSQTTKGFSQTTKGSSQTTKGSSQSTESKNSESIEIPISYGSPKNTHRRLSKHLSQCDPPSPADIKLVRIKSIVQKMEGMEEKIAEFVDPVQNKNYLYISEALMKILLDLDTVDSEGFDIVRKARKEGVRTVQALVDKLEAKLEENKRNSNQE